jgi:hypothetical protein
MQSSSEAGEGRIGSIVGFIVLIGVALAAWHVLPAFVADYTFADKLHEVARVNRYQYNDERIMEMVMKEASRQRIDVYLGRDGCKIMTRETSRTIDCKYQRTIEILPSWSHTFKFTPSADQPLI